jgi:heptosyltransferase-1
MGDLVHALPAVSDAAQAIPGIHFDWVVDEAFADIPKLHPAIENVITTAHRRWKREKWKVIENKELITLWHNLRQKKYDIVIDAQNNLKSAVITSLTRGLRCGMDKASAREKFVQLAYNKAFYIPVEQHAIDRRRQLFAQALNYKVPNTFPDFAIQHDKLPAIPLDLPKPYLVFVHSTTWDTKHWPEPYWLQLIRIATAAGYHVVLPWGNAVEQARAERLAKASSATTVLPRLSIMQQATVLANATGAVCVDTGLGHLTAALGTPAVHMYGPTDPGLIGATGRNQLHLIAEYECAPCYLHECKFGPESACFLKNMQPERVWQSMQTLL